MGSLSAAGKGAPWRGPAERGKMALETLSHVRRSAPDVPAGP